MKFIRFIVTIPKGFLYLLFYIVYGFSFFFPRNKKIWVFDSWRGIRFADNSKYFFLYVSEYEKDITPIWLTRSNLIKEELQQMGYKVYLTYSVLGLWYTLRAKVLFSDSHPFSICFWLSGGMTKINLWHGLPLKKILYDSLATKKHNWMYSSKGLKWFWHAYFSPEYLILGDYVLATSSFWKQIFSSAFKLPEDKVLIAGYPRNDGISYKIENRLIGVDMESLELMRLLRSKGQKTVLYMPTFREGSTNPLLKSNLDFDSLNGFFKGKDTHFFIKFHHEKNDTPFNYSNIHIIDANSDAYPILEHTDILLTDYSSIYFDFLLLNRPIVFFAYDYKDYTRALRELYFDYESFTPGPKAYTLEELEVVLTDTIHGVDEYSESRKDLYQKIFETEPEELVSQKLYKIVKNLIDMLRY